MNPDLVVFTGDLFANYAKYNPTENTIAFLGKIEAKYGKEAFEMLCKEKYDLLVVDWMMPKMSGNLKSLVST